MTMGHKVLGEREEKKKPKKCAATGDNSMTRVTWSIGQLS